MKMYSGKMILAVLLSFGIVSFAYAIDRVGSPQKGPTVDAPAPEPGEQGAMKAPPPGTASTIRGEILKIEGGTEGGFYTVKDASGKEVRLHVNKDTKMDGSFQVGDKVEARSNTAGHALYIKNASGAGMGSDSGMGSGSPPLKSTPSKLDSGAPGTPGGAAPGTSSGTAPSTGAEPRP
jgi:hypothetical protein